MAQCPVKSCEIYENSPANRFCKICEQFFCHPCEISHLKIRPCRNHVFQDADKVNVEVKTPVCEQHAECFTHYCKTCTALICYICLPATHKTHDFCMIDDEAKEKKQSLEKEVRQAEDKISNARIKISYIQSTLRTFEEEAEKSKKDIEEKVDVIVGTLYDMKNDFLKSIDEYKLEESQKIEPEILKRINLTNNCQEVLNKMKRAVDGNNNINLLESSSDMTKTLQLISGMSDWKTLPTRVRFDPVSCRPEPEILIGKITFLKSQETVLQKYQREPPFRTRRRTDGRGYITYRK